LSKISGRGKTVYAGPNDNNIKFSRYFGHFISPAQELVLTVTLRRENITPVLRCMGSQKTTYNRVFTKAHGSPMRDSSDDARVEQVESSNAIMVS
jgi:hypothetical protein